MSVDLILPNYNQMDSLVDGVYSIAEGLGAYQIPETWAAIQRRVRGGVIGRILQPGDQVEVDHASILTADVEGEGVTSASVVKDTFLEMAGTGKTDYVFTYNGANWLYDGVAVTLSNYGITPTGTAQDGDVITIHRTATTYDFDVEGLDEMQTVNESLEHNLSILMHGVYSQINFDPAQYLFAVTTESLADLGISGNVLPAGTYNITLDHGDYANNTLEDGTYEFTTTQDIPKGGGIRHTTIGTSQTTYQKSNVTGGTFTTYGADTFTEIESGLVTTEGSSGTSLGTATARDPQYKVGDYINFTDRQRYGSNRWATSWLRQLLNCEDATFVWAPQTIFSRNLNISPAPEGYLHTIDPELRAVLAKTRTRYAKCISDGYGYEDVEDFVTLETMLDVYGSNNNSIAEGPVTADGTVTRTTYSSLWKDAAQADKIKYQSGTARNWWLGSVYPSFGYNQRIVNTSGALYNHFAYHSYGVVPRLTIA